MAVSTKRTVRYVRQGVQGDAGADAVVYKLLPSTTAIAFTRDSNDNLTPSSYTVYCGYTKTVGETMTSYLGTTTDEVKDIDDKYNIAFRTTEADGTVGDWWWNWYQITMPIASTTNYVNIEYVLVPNTIESRTSITDADILDRVTIAITKDGEKGEPGTDGTSVNIKGTLTSTDDLPSDASAGDGYLIDGNLYVYGEDGEWIPAGQIQGPAGSSAYIYVLYADSASPDDDKMYTSPTGHSYIGIYTGTESTRPSSADVYVWSKFVGNDGTTTTVYTLNCSPTVLHYDADGNLTTTSITINITEYNGSTSSQLSVVPSGMVVYARTSNGYDITSISGSSGLPALITATTTLDHIDLCNSDGDLLSRDVLTRVDDGATGNGISSVTEQYGTSTSTTSEPTTWSANVSSLTYDADNKYLWNREKIIYTDGTESEWTTPAIIGVFGEDGKGIAGVEEQYQISTSKTTEPTTWRSTGDIPTLDSSNKYLWNRERLVYDDGTYSEWSTGVVIGVYGDQGDPGDDAVSYKLRPSCTALTFKRAFGELTPSSYTISCGYTKTQGSTITTYDGSQQSEVYNIDGEYFIFFRYLCSDGTYVPTSAWYWANDHLTVTISNDTDYVGVEYIIAHNITDNSSSRIEDTNIVDKVTIPITKDGAVGPTLRGPQVWSDLGDNYQFYSGADGETFIDIVYYGSQYYYCKTSHTKSSDTYPGSDASDVEELWGVGSSYSLVATNILLAESALIKFLQGNQLLMLNGSTVCAGMQGVTGSGYPFWVGSNTPDSAPARIDYQGNAHFENAHLGGYLHSSFKAIADSDATEDDNNGLYYTLNDDLNVIVGAGVQVTLPTTSDYVGARVLILNDDYTMLNGAANSLTTVVCGGGGSFYGSELVGYGYVDSYGYYFSGCQSLSFAGGIMEFVCVAQTDSNGNTAYNWILANNGSGYLAWHGFCVNTTITSTVGFVIDKRGQAEAQD